MEELEEDLPMSDDAIPSTQAQGVAGIGVEKLEGGSQEENGFGFGGTTQVRVPSMQNLSTQRNLLTRNGGQQSNGPARSATETNLLRDLEN